MNRSKPNKPSQDGFLSPSGTDGFREETLQRALTHLRRVRRQRRLARMAGLLAVALVLGPGVWWAFRHLQPTSPVHQISLSQPDDRIETVPGTDIRILSDEDLLALLGDRPLAVIGPAGNQRLVLLDEINPP